MVSGGDGRRVQCIRLSASSKKLEPHVINGHHQLRTSLGIASDKICTIFRHSVTIF